MKACRTSLLFFACCILAAVSPLAFAHTIERVSVAPDGSLQGNDDSGSYNAISADGRFVAFRSSANNLVPEDTNGCDDSFVYDRIARQTERVSVASDGKQANSYSYDVSISADGSVVGFTSRAGNLVPGDANGATTTWDVFVHDRATHQTERVSVSSDGIEANGDSVYAAMSDDGRFVAFWSSASNLVPEDTNGCSDIFVRDRATGSTERISAASGGGQGDGECEDSPAISADGRFVAFASSATNLVPSDTNGKYDIFVHDRTTGVTERVSVASGVQANDWSRQPSVSADGRFVAFQSYASNLVPGDTSPVFDIFVHDRTTGLTERVSVASDGSQGDSHSEFPVISANGRFVAFDSYATSLAPGDTNRYRDVFVHDRATGQTQRVSVASSGTEGNGESVLPSISGDGLIMAFASGASNLVDWDTNMSGDVFVAANEVAPDGSLAGQVRALGTSAAIQGATVGVYAASELQRSGSTDADGLYQIGALVPGQYVIAASKQGYVTQTKAYIAVTSGQTTYVNFNLDVSGRLMGQICERGTGANVEGATVTARSGGVERARTITGANGIYVMESDLLTGTCVVSVSKPGWVTQTKTNIGVTAGATTYVNFFAFERAPSVKGQVCIAGTGTPIGDATVSINSWGSLTVVVTATTDANGIYRFPPGLPSGTYILWASKTGYVTQTKTNIASTEGETRYVNFNLQISGKLKGQVRDKITGAPIIGATVSARTGGVVRATAATTAPYGIYEIDSDLPAGTYTMLCTATGYQDFGRIGIVVTAGNTTYVNFPLSYSAK